MVQRQLASLSNENSPTEPIIQPVHVHLWMRAETKPLEHRAVLTPSVCKTLLNHGT
jgi:hypothetical protein